MSSIGVGLSRSMSGDDNPNQSKGVSQTYTLGDSQAGRSWQFAIWPDSVKKPMTALSTMNLSLLPTTKGVRAMSHLNISMLIVTLVFFLSPSVSAEDTPEFEQTYDKFTDRSTLKLKLGVIISGRDHKAKLEVVQFFDGKLRSKDNNRPHLHFNSDSDDGWVYLEYHPFNLLVDGERMKFEIEHDGTVGKGYVLEHMWADLTASQFKALSSAKTVEGKLGSHEFALKPNQIAAIKEFDALLSDPERPLPETPNKLMSILGGPAKQKPTFDPKAIPAGEGVLWNGYSQSFPIASNAKVFDEWDRFVDKSGLSSDFLSRKKTTKEIVLVDSNTRVSILERLERPKSVLFKRITRIKILDGPQKGTNGWTDDMGITFGPPDPEALKLEAEANRKADLKRQEAELQGQITQKFNLGQALEKSNIQGALKYYSEVIKLNPESSQAKKAKARIKALSK